MRLLLFFLPLSPHATRHRAQHGATAAAAASACASPDGAAAGGAHVLERPTILFVPGGACSPRRPRLRLYAQIILSMQVLTTTPHSTSPQMTVHHRVRLYTQMSSQIISISPSSVSAPKKR